MADRNLEIALRIKADLESARKQLDELAKSVKATGDNSKASADKLGAVGKRIGEMEAEADKANKTLGQTDKVTAGAAGNAKTLGRETAKLARNLKNGNFDGAATNISKLGAASGLAEAGVAAMAVGIGAAVAVLAVLAVGAFKGYQESERLRVSVIATGGAAGVSAVGFDQMASSVGGATGQFGEARKAIELLAASGKVAGAGIGGLAMQAVNMSIVTGESIDKSVAKILEIGERPAAAIAKLNEQYHFLTAAQYEEIAAMEAAGDVRGAARLANQLDAQAMAERAKDVQDNAGLMERAAHGVAEAWDKTWDSIKGIGRAPNPSDVATALETQIDNLTKGYQLGKTWMPGVGKDDPRVKALQAQLTEIRRKQTAAGFAANKRELAARTEADAIAAQQATARFDAPGVKRDDAIKRASRHMADQLGAQGLTDADRERIKTRYANEVTAANEAFAAATKKDSKRTPGTNDTASREAEARARAATAAQQGLVQSLGQLQSQLDPVAGAWVRYNATVANANAQVDEYKAKGGKNVAVVEAQRTAVLRLAEAQREATLAALRHAAAASQLSSVMQQAQAALNDQARQEQMIQAEQQAGLISDYTARKRIVDLHQKTAAALDQLLPKLRELAAATGDPQAVQQVEQLRNQIELLKLQANDLKMAFESGLTSGLEQALEGLATRTMTVAEAFRTLARTVIQSLAQVAARALAAKAIDALGSMFGKGDQKADVGAGATKLATAGAIVGGAAVMLGTNADKLQAAATTLLIANSMSLAGGGFAGGGYTGDLGVGTIAGVVHGKEYVQPARVVQQPGALAFMRDFHRHGMAALQAWAPGYADGGFVHPLADVPRMRSTAPSRPRLAAPAEGAGRPPSVALRNVNVIDPALVRDYLESSEGEEVVVNLISRNETRLRLRS